MTILLAESAEDDLMSYLMDNLPNKIIQVNSLYDDIEVPNVATWIRAEKRLDNTSGFPVCIVRANGGDHNPVTHITHVDLLVGVIYIHRDPEAVKIVVERLLAAMVDLVVSGYSSSGRSWGLVGSIQFNIDALFTSQSDEFMTDSSFTVRLKKYEM